MMEELSAKLGFHHENSTPYYLQANGRVEAINKVLKTMLRRMVGDHKSNTFTRKSAPTLLRYTPSLSLALSPNGGSITCIVSVPQPGGMVTSS